MSRGGHKLQVKWVNCYDEDDVPIYETKVLPILWNGTGFAIEWSWYNEDYDNCDLKNAIEWMEDSLNENFDNLEFQFISSQWEAK